MRPVLLAIAVLLALGLAASFIFLGGPGGTAGGWTATTPTVNLQRFDLERRALRQLSLTIADSTGRQVTHQLTLLGPTRRVFEPWTTVTADFDGAALWGLDGTVTAVPPGSATAFWDEVGGGWEFSPETFADCSPLPDLIDGSSLADHLCALFPDRGALVLRAFPSEGARK